MIAYCIRFWKNLQLRKNNETICSSLLTSSEIHAARCSLIRLVQIEFFSKEIKLLTESKELPKGNSISQLNPFVDSEDRLLRVGGRLEHSSLSREAKHPPILPKQSHLSKLFIHFAHLSSSHGGPTLTSSILQQHVWIPSGKRLVKSEFRSCMTCQRVRPRSAHQLMSDLSAERVNPSRPFTCTGLDYAGPFSLRLSKGRGQRTLKGYVALFICFATRAIHLELVSDLTTGIFLQAYRRFVGRRLKELLENLSKCLILALNFIRRLLKC